MSSAQPDTRPPDTQPVGTDAQGRVVAHFPAANHDPYLRLLTQSLADAGFTTAKNATFSLSWLWRNRQQPCVLHFHWPSLYYETTRNGPVQNSLLRLLLWGLFMGKLMFAKGLGFRLLWTAHNLLPHGAHQRLYRLERQISCRLWHGVIAHCDHTLNALRRQFGFAGHGVVLPHGSLAGYYPTPENSTAASARAKLSLPEDCFIYLHFGKIRPYKGLDLLLSACRTLAANANAHNWLLLIAGDGDADHVDRLQAASSDIKQVRWLRQRIPDDQVATCFLAADAVVLPYRRVTTSGNLVLAQAFAKPLVIPNIGCLPAMASPDGAVIYTPDDTGTALADAMLRVQHLDADKADKAARDSEAQRQWPDIGRQTAAFYERLRATPPNLKQS